MSLSLLDWLFGFTILFGLALVYALVAVG